MSGPEWPRKRGVMNISKAVREAVGLEDGDEPAFWPAGNDLSDPSLVHYLHEAQAWVSLSKWGDCPIKGIYILHGDPDDGFEWQATGQQFADYACKWDRLIAAYDR